MEGHSDRRVSPNGKKVPLEEKHFTRGWSLTKGQKATRREVVLFLLDAKLSIIGVMLIILPILSKSSIIVEFLEAQSLDDSQRATKFRWAIRRVQEGFVLSDCY